MLHVAFLRCLLRLVPPMLVEQSSYLQNICTVHRVYRVDYCITDPAVANCLNDPSSAELSTVLRYFIYEKLPFTAQPYFIYRLFQVKLLFLLNCLSVVTWLRHKRPEHAKFKCFLFINLFARKSSIFLVYFITIFCVRLRNMFCLKLVAKIIFA